MVSTGLRIGKYELTKQLGRGGFGVVFVALDHSLGRECALKFLLPEHNARADLLDRFVLEAKSAAQIGHPGIVTVYECGVFRDTETRADGTAYIAMELLEGESLAARMRRGVMDEVAATMIAKQVAAALGAAHEAGIIHRDLKPDNVFVVPDAAAIGGERVKVLDFGIAKLADAGERESLSAATATFQVFGTPKYMSPEQCRSSTNVDARTDIYALGCIMFELIAGRPPFLGESGEQIAHHQLTPPPRVTGASDVYADAVAAMLAKPVEARPPTMAAVVRLLDRKLAAGSHEAVGRGSAGAPPGGATVVSLAPSSQPAAPAPAPTPAAPARRILPHVLGAAAIAAIAATIAILVTRRDDTPTSTITHVLDVTRPSLDAAPADTGSSAARKQCEPHIAGESWAALAECAEQIRALDPKATDELKAISARELTSVAAMRELTDLLEHHPLPTSAVASYAKIDPASVYQIRARSQLKNYYRGVAQSLAAHHLCAQLDDLRTNGSTLPLDTREDLERTSCAPRGDISRIECTEDKPSPRAAELLAQKPPVWSIGLQDVMQSIDCRKNHDQPFPELARIATRAACHQHHAQVARIVYEAVAHDAKSALIAECKSTGIALEPL